MGIYERLRVQRELGYVGEKSNAGTVGQRYTEEDEMLKNHETNSILGIQVSRWATSGCQVSSLQQGLKAAAGDPGSDDVSGIMAA